MTDSMRPHASLHALSLLIAATIATSGVLAADVTLVVSDPDGTAARVAAPVSTRINLQKRFGPSIDATRLRLVEDESTIPVQFVPDSVKRNAKAVGTLWWLMPPGPKGERRFRLTVANRSAPGALAIRATHGGDYYDVTEGQLPVLRYNFGNVPVPEETPAHFAKGESYERGDYISPLYGPRGEVLTEDYPHDHAHHRGVWWSWPVTRWRDEVFDIWAVVGVHARPIAMNRAETGAVLAVLEPTSVWKWKDQDPIVREQVTIRAFRRRNLNRTIDVEVRLTALVDGVAIGGRPKAGYGGFSLRAAPCQERKITLHAGPEAETPRRTWMDYSGVFAGGSGPSGVTLFEHVSNPDYPNPQQEYPAVNCIMPAFPGAREVSLRKGKTLVLKHRLWIHPGTADENQLSDVWSAYTHPPKVRVEE